MRLRRPSLAEFVVAALCGLWVGFFLATETGWAVPVAVGAAGLTLVLPQRPLLAGAALAVLQLLLAVARVTDGTPAMLAPVILAVYAIGRHAPTWPGIAIAAAFRRRLIQLVLRFTLLLAIIGAIVLVPAYLPLLVVAAIAGVAILAIAANVRELRA